MSKRFQSLGCLLLICLCLQTQATPAITPNCPAGESLNLGLQLSTYNTIGYNSLINSYAIPAKLFGSGQVYNISGSGNPYGSNDNYLSLFTGFIQAPVTGVYGIGVDGDDAVEVIIDGVIITGWYGGHGRAGFAKNTVNINLDAGYHSIEFRQQERGGGDNYYLYWKKPGDANYTIVPNSNLETCQPNLVLKPAVTPSCANPIPQLALSTYNKAGYGHPGNHSQYNSLIANYAIPSKLFNAGFVNNINGSGNPYGTNSNYLSIFKGYIYAPTSALYAIGIDGDDAVEVLIDGDTITGWYSGHGRAGSAQYVTNVSLEAGYHELAFHHEESAGGDNYYLYWRTPADANMKIVAPSSLSHCPYTANISLSKTSKTLSDPMNGTNQAKAIPGAVVEYTITAKNTGSAPATNNIIRDSLNAIITTRHYASWASGFITIKTPSLYGGVKTTLTDAADSDPAQFINTAGSRELSVDCGTLTTGQSCIVTYRIILD